MSPKPPAAILRPLKPSDPRSLEHPDNEEAWLELARSIGRSMARADWNRRAKENGGEPDDKNGSELR